MVLVPSSYENLALGLFLLSKFFISASFMIIYPFSGELYPTQVRAVGIATSSYVGGIGIIIIPFLTYMVRIVVLKSHIYLHINMMYTTLVRAGQ